MDKTTVAHGPAPVKNKMVLQVAVEAVEIEKETNLYMGEVLYCLKQERSLIVNTDAHASRTTRKISRRYTSALARPIASVAW
jgi:hypothetical protein